MPLKQVRLYSNLEYSFPPTRTDTCQLPLLTSHMMAVLSTEAEAIKFPSAAQQISYTSSKWPLQSEEEKKGEKQMSSQQEKNHQKLGDHTLGF